MGHPEAIKTRQFSPTTAKQVWLMSLQFFNRGLRSGRLLQTYISAVGIWSSGLVGGTGVLRTISSADGVAGINRQESKRIFPKKRTWVPIFVSGQIWFAIFCVESVGDGIDFRRRMFFHDARLRPRITSFNL